MYVLPFGKNERFFSNPNWITNALLGGWQIGGTFATQSGFPIAFGAYNLTTAATSNDMFYKGGTISGPRTIDQWINTAAFLSVYDVGATAATPVSHLRTLPFRFSGVRRDYIQNVDLSLKKDIMLRESMKIQLKFEALNAFNHPYFVAPVVSPSATNFGAISASNQDNYARRIQLGVKFIF
jgi:hypothetical protein